MAGEESPSKEAAIAWEGDSLDVISGFPDAVKANLGFQLRLLQIGQQRASLVPSDLSLKDRRSDPRPPLLREESRETSRRDIDLARKRFKDVQARLREEPKHGHRN